MTSDQFTILDQLRECADEATILKLVRAKGGQRVYVPASVERDHWLSQAVGLEAARKISEYFCTNGGMQMIVPIGGENNRSARRRAIHRMLDEGASLNEVAAALNISYKTAEYHATRKRKTSVSAGPDLFSQ